MPFNADQSAAASFLLESEFAWKPRNEWADNAAKEISTQGITEHRKGQLDRFPEQAKILRTAGYHDQAKVLEDHHAAETERLAKEKAAAPPAPTPWVSQVTNTTPVPGYVGPLLKSERRKAILAFIRHPNAKSLVDAHGVNSPGLDAKEALTRAEAAFEAYHAAQPQKPITAQPQAQAAAPEAAAPAVQVRTKGGVPKFNDPERVKAGLNSPEAIARKMGLLVGDSKSIERAKQAASHFNAIRAGRTVPAGLVEKVAKNLDQHGYIKAAEAITGVARPHAPSLPQEVPQKRPQVVSDEQLKSLTSHSHMLDAVYPRGTGFEMDGFNPSPGSPKTAKELQQAGYRLPDIALHYLSRHGGLYGNEAGVRAAHAAYLRDINGNPAAPAPLPGNSPARPVAATATSPRRPVTPPPLRITNDDLARHGANPAAPQGRFAALIDAAKKGQLKDHIENGLGNFFDKFERVGNKALRKIGIPAGDDDQQFSRPQIEAMEWLLSTEFARVKPSDRQRGFVFDEKPAAKGKGWVAPTVERKPKQRSFGWEEDKVVREKSAHDGKRPGEFAPRITRPSSRKNPRNSTHRTNLSKMSTSHSTPPRGTKFSTPMESVMAHSEMKRRPRQPPTNGT